MTVRGFKQTKDVGKRWVEKYPDGTYSKVGGGSTPHLQEAQVLGWNAPRDLAKRVAYYNKDGKWKSHHGHDYHPGYELVEVTLVAKRPPVYRGKRKPCRLVDLGVNWCACHGPCL